MNEARPVAFHTERQDTGSAGWLRLLELIDEAAADRREVFTPLTDMTNAERRDVITLPASIGTLTHVKHLSLYASNLVRMPPEIGAMSNLEVFDTYQSLRLHWYPYELTRCTRLNSSRVSTRALYGNFKYRPPFPDLRPPAEPGPSCSVCAGPAGDAPGQVWISLGVGTDVLPFLVNACSAACVAALPRPPGAYVATPHTGGPEVVQPTGR